MEETTRETLIRRQKMLHAKFSELAVERSELTLRMKDLVHEHSLVNEILKKYDLIEKKVK